MGIKSTALHCTAQADTQLVSFTGSRILANAALFMVLHGVFNLSVLKDNTLPLDDLMQNNRCSSWRGLDAVHAVLEAYFV